MMTFKLGHRPGLDGFRGVSVLLVILCHIETPWFNLRGGFIGVHFFFVLSGFLITSLLLEEQKRTARISLGDFYMRRALRLLPALVLFLATISAVGAGIESAEMAAKIRTSSLMALLYSSNWFLCYGGFPADFLLCHTWSLSVEEQFYIVWPVVLVLLLKILDRRRIAAFVLTSIVALAAWRAYLWTFTLDKNRVYFGSDTNANAILIGVLLALLMSIEAYPKSPRALQATLAAGVVMVLLTVIALFKLTPYTSAALDWWVYVGGIQIVDLGAAVMILAILTTPLHTLFEHRPLVWVGRVSYGLYLWHYPIIHWARERSGIGYFADLGSILLTFAVAAASFYAIEQPILKLKNRFQVGEARCRAA